MAQVSRGHTEVPFPSLLLMYVVARLHRPSAPYRVGYPLVPVYTKKCSYLLPTVPIYPEPPSGRYGAYYQLPTYSSAGRQGPSHVW